MIYKSVKSEIKIGNLGSDLIIEAYASIFDNIDSGRDRMRKGAFTKTLNENSKRIKTLFNHDWNQIIGKPIEIHEDSKGLYTKTRFVDTPKSREIYELAKEDIVNELSIGYDVIKNSYQKEQKVNDLLEVKLYEYSFVTFAMNEQAQVIDVKTLINELKSGRVLSDKNVGSIRKIIESLTALLEDSGNETKPNNTSLCNDPTEQKSHEYDLLLAEIKKMRGVK